MSKIINRHRRIFGSLKFKRKYISIAAAVIILFVIAVSVFAPTISPYKPDAQDLSNSLQQASKAHLLGTDMQGRDLLSRVLYGGRSTMLGAFLIVLISTLIGVPIGLISGYAGGFIDNLIMRIWDVLLAFPALFLAFFIVALAGRGMEITVVTLAIVYIPMISRLTRSVAMVEREQAYVEAARALGLPHHRIIFIHILPNCISPILVQTTIDFAYAILDLAAMSFLGLGVQPPTADWGSMLADGREYIMLLPNIAIAPGLAIMLSVISFNLLGEGLQEYLDPRRSNG